MIDAIGQSLPIAVGVMVSPLPIVAVVLMLLSGSARANALTFVVTWFVAVGGVTLLVGLLAGASTPDNEAPPAWSGWVKIVLGALLLLLAVRQWQARPRGDANAATPKWMAAVDSVAPVKAAGLALLLGVVNPKNLLLVVAAGAAMASAAPGDTAGIVGASIVFAVIASIGVAAPVVVYFATGDRAAEILAGLKQWLVQHNAVVMAVLLLVIGTKLIGDGLTIV